jgi:hypothetical protein
MTQTDFKIAAIGPETGVRRKSFVFYGETPTQASDCLDEWMKAMGSRILSIDAVAVGERRGAMGAPRSYILVVFKELV